MARVARVAVALGALLAPVVVSSTGFSTEELLEAVMAEDCFGDECVDGSVAMSLMQNRVKYLQAKEEQLAAESAASALGLEEVPLEAAHGVSLLQKGATVRHSQVVEGAHGHGARGLGGVVRGDVSLTIGADGLAAAL
mmetsp:Transcript_52915/g.146558  ORF Transcript_52915/g.146558 Transcript_52915/m.146558 type:complete len:138 (-) Transcript_52915:312-725(-)